MLDTKKALVDGIGSLQWRINRGIEIYGDRLKNNLIEFLVEGEMLELLRSLGMYESEDSD